MTKNLGLFVKNTSRRPVIDSWELIKNSFLPKHKFITKTNPLELDALNSIEKHINTRRQFNLRYRDVSTYIAASTLSHLLDGWGYLANSIQAQLSGNEGASIHLGYYAELRSVMSFLAAEGIGVFSNKHLGLNAVGSFTVFNKHRKKVNGAFKERSLGTHVFAWDALEKWCNSAIKPSSDILEVFSVKGFDFKKLTEGFDPSATVLRTSAIAKNWLLDWAFDIRRFRNDRELRNLVSYRPQTISNFNDTIDFKSTISQIYTLFEVLSPLQSDPFHLVDRYLLKALYNELYVELNLSTRYTLEELIVQCFSNLGATADSSLIALLLSNAPYADEHLIFSEALKRETKALPVISRAALMLRISTGVVSRVLKDANISKDELSFVWENYGFNNGFWNSMGAIDEFYKLWIEIEEDYSAMLPEFDQLNNSPYVVRKGVENLNNITQLNRAVLWGL